MEMGEEDGKLGRKKNFCKLLLLVYIRYYKFCFTAMLQGSMVDCPIAIFPDSTEYLGHLGHHIEALKTLRR
jgi:hypothetical protein